MRPIRLALTLGVILGLLGFLGFLRLRETGENLAAFSPEVVQGALLGAKVWETSQGSGCQEVEAPLLGKDPVRYRFDFTGGCGVWPGRLGVAESSYGYQLRFGFWIHRKGGTPERYLAQVFQPRYPRTLGGYAWVFLEGPRSLEVKGPVYAGTPLRKRAGELTLTASCPKPAPGFCHEAPAPLGREEPLYRPWAPVPTLGNPIEAQTKARQGGLLLSGEVRVYPRGQEVLLRTREGTYRITQYWVYPPKGGKRLFSGFVWAPLVKVEPGYVGFPLTLAGRVVEAIAPVRGDTLGLWGQARLSLRGEGAVEAALLAQRGPLEASAGTRVVGSVAAYQYAPLPLTFRPSEPPGFPALESPGPLILGLKPLR